MSYRDQTLPPHLIDIEYIDEGDIYELFYDDIVELIEDGCFDEAVIHRSKDILDEANDDD